MLVKLEKTKDWREVLVADELDKFLGLISLGVFHKYCLEKKETLEIDEYIFYYVSKERLIRYLK